MREIARYTLKTWGEDQTRVYIAQLEQCAENLATGNRLYKDMSVIHPKLRMVLCGHHYIFCLPREDTPALVIAILHERMDIMTRLKSRLARG